MRCKRRGSFEILSDVINSDPVFLTIFDHFVNFFCNFSQNFYLQKRMSDNAKRS